MEICLDLNAIYLFLYTIERTIKITCDKQNKIRWLKRFLKYDDEYLFINNGSVIDENQTFEKASISNGSILFAIQAKCKQTDSFHKLMRLSNDSEFELQLKITTNAGLKSEYLRLKDMTFKKIELKMRNYQFLQLEDLNDLSKKKDVILNINYKQLPCPSTDPLPIFWVPQNVLSQIE